METLKLLNNQHQNSATPDKHLIVGKLISTLELCAFLNRFYTEVGGEPIQTTAWDIRINAFQHPHPLSISEAKHLLTKLDPRKSACADDFPTWIFHDSIKDMRIPVHEIINSMLSTGKYPDKWKNHKLNLYLNVNHSKSWITIVLYHCFTIPAKFQNNGS